MAAYERGILITALAASGGNRTEAAKSLGIGRATLYEKLERYKIEAK
jgi:two-component system response regulator HydG